MNPQALIATVLAALVFAVGWSTRGWHEAALREAKAEAEAKLSKIVQAQSDQAAQDHEAVRAALATQQRVITREIDHVVEKPIYRNVCLDDDGMRILNAAIGAPAASQPEFAAALPSPAASQ